MAPNLDRGAGQDMTALMWLVPMGQMEVLEAMEEMLEDQVGND